MKTLFATLLFASTAFAGTPVIMATGQGHAYATQQHAIHDALVDASTHYTSEYGGVVYELHGKYYYTTPTTVEEASSVRFEIRMLRSAHLIALYHTHPPGAKSDLFSQCDVDVANQLHVPSYILVLGKGEIRSFTPGVDKTFQLGGGVFHVASDVSYGTLVAKVSLKNVGMVL